MGRENKFSVLLSAKVYSGKPEETEKNKSLIRYPYLASPKLDGWRAIEYNDSLYGRSLKPIPNHYTRKLMEEFFRVAKEWGIRGLDGELVAGDSTDHNAMQASQSAFSARDGEPEFTFHVFDSYQFSSERFEERLRRVSDLCQNLSGKFPYVKEVPHYRVSDWDNTQSLLQSFLDQGYEGLMGRCPNGHYKLGRSSMREGILWALKPYLDDEGEIVDFEEEMQNNNEMTRNELGYAERKGGQAGLSPKGRLGAFVCTSPNWPGVTFNVGAGVGMTHELRQKVWDNRGEYLGKFVKFKYQQVGNLHKPRQPKFMGFRSPEDM